MRHALRILVALAFGTVALTLAFPVMALALPFWAVARLAALLHFRLEPPTRTWQSLIEFCPRVGWKPKANVDAYAMADDVFHVVTDREGWRGRTSLDDSEIVVFGDSHAFGHGIDEPNYFGNRTQSLRVKAIAANGYNMVQEVMWMKRLASELVGKLVVWFVFPANDILDNLEVSMGLYRSPFLRQKAYNGEWETVDEHIQPTPWSFTLQRYRATNYDRIVKVYCTSATADRAFAACDYLIAEAQAVCKRAGVKLVIFTVPDPLVMSDRGLRTLEMHGAKRAAIDPSLPDQRLRRICETRGIPMIAGVDYLTIEDYPENEDHWNARGHKRVAEILEHCYALYMDAKDPDRGQSKNPSRQDGGDPALSPSKHQTSDQT